MRYLLIVLLSLVSCAAEAQTGCTPKSQATILSSMADTAAAGSITAQVMRNFVCSTLQINIPSGQIYIGNSSGLGAAVTPTGDVTLSSAGVFTVGAIGSVTPNTGAFTTGTISTLLHMAQPASIQFDGTRTWSGSQAAVGNAEIYSFTNQSGSTTATARVSFHYFGIASDTVQATHAISNIMSEVTTGAAITGSRNGIWSNLTIGGQPGDSGQYSAGQFAAQANAPANASGNLLYGTNPTCGINGAATGPWACIGEEIDVAARTGSTPTATTGLSIVTVGGHTAHGSQNLDSAVVVGNQAGTTTGWDYGLRFGGPMTAFPFVSTATLIFAYQSSSGLTIANGVDFTNLTFTGAAWKSTGFLVDGSGNVTGASYKVASTAGVTCSGSPTSSFASIGGIVTHC